ncbi:hypothetical protein ET495_10315 [Xylanimonas allomyrinae]|uniref:LPXTG cell wall anchor domain-containing protein n=1 Tax=Xylanimonas allomyrinae TaxID=2509459 RepID=A0A4P6EMD7_9MICO|nr:hypothetical protein [Xylanimonas allomyrinae]QAY63575.1 hypothetical protein ET495_10315 [Xylanimonas allomyrinae]
MRHPTLRLAGAALVAAGLIGPALPAAAAPPAPDPSSAEVTLNATGWSLSFTLDGPDTPAWQTIDLTASALTAWSATHLAVTGEGDLADTITTTVLGCTVPWDDGTCPGRQVVLAQDWTFDHEADVPYLPIGPAGAAHLRVGVTATHDASPGETATVRYVLTASGDDARPALPGNLPRTGATSLPALLAATALLGASLALLGASLAQRRRATVRSRTGES